MQSLLHWERSKHYMFWVCVCGLRYQACKAHAPYCHLWPAPPCNIFPQYLINARVKKIVEHKMCVWIFSTTFVWNISHSKQNWARCDKKMYIGLHVKYRLFLSDFNKIWIFSTDFRKKYHISNFMNIRIVEAELFHADGQMDRHYEANSCFSPFCESS